MQEQAGDTGQAERRRAQINGRDVARRLARSEGEANVRDAQGFGDGGGEIKPAAGADDQARAFDGGQRLAHPFGGHLAEAAQSDQADDEGRGAAEALAFGA